MKKINSIPYSFCGRTNSPSILWRSYSITIFTSISYFATVNYVTILNVDTKISTICCLCNHLFGRMLPFLKRSLANSLFGSFYWRSLSTIWKYGFEMTSVFASKLPLVATKVKNICLLCASIKVMLTIIKRLFVPVIW